VEAVFGKVGIVYRCTITHTWALLFSAARGPSEVVKGAEGFGGREVLQTRITPRQKSEPTSAEVELIVQRDMQESKQRTDSARVQDRPPECCTDRQEQLYQLQILKRSRFGSTSRINPQSFRPIPIESSTAKWGQSYNW